MTFEEILPQGTENEKERAIASGRKLLLLDEPTSGLDHAHMLETARLLQQLKEDGITILVVTHDSELIHACCTRRLLFSPTPEQPSCEGKYL